MKITVMPLFKERFVSARKLKNAIAEYISFRYAEMRRRRPGESCWTCAFGDMGRCWNKDNATKWGEAPQIHQNSWCGRFSHDGMTA